jgi:hypothetical protein
MNFPRRTPRSADAAGASTAQTPLGIDLVDPVHETVLRERVVPDALPNHYEFKRLCDARKLNAEVEQSKAKFPGEIPAIRIKMAYKESGKTLFLTESAVKKKAGQDELSYEECWEWCVQKQSN